MSCGFTANSSIRTLAFIGGLAFSLASHSAHAVAFFVRANMSPAVELHVDSQTAVTRNNVSANGQAFGHADLASGSLQALSQANASGTSSVSSWVDFDDTISILGVTEATAVTVELHVTGTISGIVPQVFAFLTIGSAFLCGPVVCQFDGPFVLEQGFWDSSSAGMVDDLLSITVPITPSQNSFVFGASLRTVANPPNGYADFGSTA